MRQVLREPGWRSRAANVRRLAAELATCVPIRMRRTRAGATEFYDIVVSGTQLIVRSGRERTSGKRRSIECHAGISVPGKYRKLIAKNEKKCYLSVQPP